MKRTSTLLLFALLIVFGSFNTAHSQVRMVKGDWVKIVNKDSHYRVTIDYTEEVSRLEVGAEYMELVKIIFPDFELNADLYLADLEYLAQFGAIPPYQELVRRAHLVLPQVPEQYQEEIEGMTSQLSGGDIDVPGDGMLSINELYILSLMPDVTRSYACSAISFFGENTRRGETITGRNLDWMMGIRGNMNKQHAVTTIRNGENSVALVGFLGTLGMITGVNDDGIFAAIFDSPVGEPAIDASSKNSYYMDLRFALENFNTKEAISSYMTDPSRDYTYNHNILLSNDAGSQVVENFVLGDRSVRYPDSTLNPGVEWPYQDAIGVVNSFILEGKPDSHTISIKNSDRWNSFLEQTDDLRLPVRLQDVQRIMSYHDGPVTSHIYRGLEYMMAYNGSGTLQQVLFDSSKNHLRVHFSPVTGPESEPVFENVPLRFAKKVKSSNADN